MEDSYLTLKARSESLYKVKGSKHFGYAQQVRNEDEIEAFLQAIKKEHHAARHHCYAWRLGLDKKRFRANDDGEPSNSAGNPILGQIKAFDLSDIMIIVVRYFGGTKLGVGGLMDAYKTAAKWAIEAGEIVETVLSSPIEIIFPPELTGEVMQQMHQLALPIEDQGFYQGNSSIISTCRDGSWEEVKKQLEGVYRVKVKKI